MKVRLSDKNIKELYPDIGNLLHTTRLGNLKALLQDDYAGDNDCTVTAIACALNIPYNKVLPAATKYGYTSKKGTNPLKVRNIMQEIISNRDIAKSAYGKGVGCTLKKLETILKTTPVVLNLWNDGRSYYKNHSVVIIGVDVYEHGVFLRVYDGWHLETSLIDYKKLSIVMSINWIEEV